MRVRSLRLRTGAGQSVAVVAGPVGGLATVSRLVNEIRGVSRVACGISGKLPAM